jgi:hypothetical protein
MGKENLREEIEALVKDFIDGGGTIQKVPSGTVTRGPEWDGFPDMREYGEVTEDEE